MSAATAAAAAAVDEAWTDWHAPFVFSLLTFLRWQSFSTGHQAVGIRPRAGNTIV